jgi:hypothetical protein
MFVLISFDANASTIPAGEGAIMKIRFQTSSTLELGDYGVNISDIHLTSTAGDDLESDPINSKLVNVLLKGDVNNDNKVNVTDCICVIDYIFGVSNATIIETMVDVNSDRKVNVSDVISIIDIIFGESPSQVRGEDENYELQDPD